MSALAFFSMCQQQNRNFLCQLRDWNGLLGHGPVRCTLLMGLHTCNSRHMLAEVMHEQHLGEKSDASLSCEMVLVHLPVRRTS